MERYRVEWRDGPNVVGGDTWVIDLDLRMSIGSAPFSFAKRLQVVAPMDDLRRHGIADPGWDIWRAMVQVAVGSVIRRVSTDDLHLERPRTPFQLAPDAAEAAKRASEMSTYPPEAAEVMSEFANN